MNWLRAKLNQAARWLPGPALNAKTIGDDLWLRSTAPYPFLRELAAHEQQQLRLLSQNFLAQKEFHGVGIQVTDDMALAIAAQACLPLLHLPGPPTQALRWYDDFVGIVVYPGQMRARRQLEDDAGVVHHYSEDLVGEAMQDGPVVLSWADVQAAATSTHEGYNVVIHEFAHKLDLRDSMADGCPPLPSSAARTHWLHVITEQYQSFCDAVQLHERFGAEAPFLDRYAATSVDEFFAVAAEAYFVNRSALQAAHPPLPALFDQFFRPKLVR